jgi:Berberine and berberine like
MKMQPPSPTAPWRTTSNQPGVAAGEPGAEEEIAWAQAFFAALEPYQTGAYANLLDRDDEDRVRIAHGADKYRRLVELKNRYDPANDLRLNHNIRPSGIGKPKRFPETGVGS